MKVTVFLFAAPVIALAVSLHRGVEPEPTHGRFASGDCASCHDEGPKYHAARTWPLAHGRSPSAIEDRCERCHAAETCIACHSLAPATHTAGFRAPGSDDRDAARHALLARARPSACLVCHGDIATDCARCHAPGDLAPIVDRGRRELVRWEEVLGDR
ncbi:hypothetical protein L6R52_07600 [Myxococcota bacterium]|nr:hypothetical protein [Myxococcota bacterium]